MASSTTAPRPTWAPEGLKEEELELSYPVASDGRADRLVLVFSFRCRDMNYTFRERIGVPTELEKEGKQCWARVDKDTGVVWVRLDRVAANPTNTNIVRESRWVTFKELEENFVRFQMPYKRSFTQPYFNPACTRPNELESDPDDREYPLTSSNNPDDRLEDMNTLSERHQARVLDQAATDAHWRARFG